jgi:hypothetical protein
MPDPIPSLDAAFAFGLHSDRHWRGPSNLLS